MNKVEELNKLKKDLESRKDIPLITSPNDVVFGDGNPDADILFIGEAAGYYESIERKPFVGQAGKLLTKIMEENGLKREGVYISNVVKARPPDNRDPLPEEIEAFKYYLDKEIEIVSPKVIVTLGRFSMGKFFPFEKISQIHGKPKVIKFKDKDITVIPMYHPAAALRATEILNKFKEDFKIIPPILEKLTAPQAQQLSLV